jgi:hypothetical protein
VDGKLTKVLCYEIPRGSERWCGPYIVFMEIDLHIVMTTEERDKLSPLFSVLYYNVAHITFLCNFSSFRRALLFLLIRLFVIGWLWMDCPRGQPLDASCDNVLA